MLKRGRGGNTIISEANSARAPCDGARNSRTMYGICASGVVYSVHYVQYETHGRNTEVLLLLGLCIKPQHIVVTIVLLTNKLSNEHTVAYVGRRVSEGRIISVETFYLLDFHDLNLMRKMVHIL